MLTNIGVKILKGVVLLATFDSVISQPSSSSVTPDVYNHVNNEACFRGNQTCTLTRNKSKQTVKSCIVIPPLDTTLYSINCYHTSNCKSDVFQGQLIETPTAGSGWIFLEKKTVCSGKVSMTCDYTYCYGRSAVEEARADAVCTGEVQNCSGYPTGSLTNWFCLPVTKSFTLPPRRPSGGQISRTIELAGVGTNTYNCKWNDICASDVVLGLFRTEDNKVYAEALLAPKSRACAKTPSLTCSGITCLSDTICKMVKGPTGLFHTGYLNNNGCDQVISRITGITRPPAGSPGIVSEVVVSGAVSTANYTMNSAACRINSKCPNDIYLGESAGGQNNMTARFYVSATISSDPNCRGPFDITCTGVACACDSVYVDVN